MRKRRTRLRRLGTWRGTVGAFAVFRKTGRKVRNGEITAFLPRAFKMRSPEFMAEVEVEIGADIRAIWMPAAENCFKRLNGPQLDALYVVIVNLTADGDIFTTFAKSRKADRNEALHKLFNYPERQKAYGVTADHKARIDAWVPACF